jgi:Bacterial SH3 domain
MKKRPCLLSVVFLLAATTTFGQQATVRRNAILRSDPTTSSRALEHLQSGAAITLLGSARQNGFYHVKAEDGHEGWVWSKNIRVQTGTTSTPQAPAEASGRLSAVAQCDDTLWDHVYNPQRLIVKQKCIAVTGTIVDATNGKWPDGVRHEPDGDTHGWLSVDTEFKSLLNAGNMSNEGGNLVFEIVCKFPVSQPDAVASCPSAYHTPVQIPPIGSRVRVVGSYVQDTYHAKWMEIHPVTSIELITDSQ